MFPFKREEAQRAFGAIFSLLGLFLTAIGLNQQAKTIFNLPMLSVGFVLFLVGLIYFIEVTFK